MQGALDIQYLGARYERGKKSVEDIMQQLQRYQVLANDLEEVQSDLISQQAGLDAPP